MIHPRIRDIQANLILNGMCQLHKLTRGISTILQGKRLFNHFGGAVFIWKYKTNFEKPNDGRI